MSAKQSPAILEALSSVPHGSVTSRELHANRQEDAASVSQPTVTVEGGTGGQGSAFSKTGWEVRPGMLSPSQRERLLQAASDPHQAHALDWDKGYGAGTRVFYEAACHRPLLDRVTELLGRDVVLWGASIQSRAPGAVHPWHSDIEACGQGGRVVSVWIGLEHAAAGSALSVIEGSHRTDETVQKARHLRQRDRQEPTSAEVEAWAKELNPSCRLAEPTVRDGDALFFDGRLWHYSHNQTQHTRKALLLQYASADTELRIPDFNRLDWPFRWLEEPRPACVVVSGDGDPSVNRIVPPPRTSGAGSRIQLTRRVAPVEVPLPPPAEGDWRTFPLFKGGTPDLRHLSCHAASLNPGCFPHPPHSHVEEEVLILLDGEADLVLPEHPEGKLRLRAGEMVYYPSYFPHTLTPTGDRAASYLMYKWRGEHRPSSSRIGFAHCQLHDTADAPGTRRSLHRGVTECLERFRSHVSTLSPGESSPIHCDPYDLSLLILEGEVELLGAKAAAHSVAFFPAGTAHGIRNAGTGPARYLVLEFHGRRTLSTSSKAEKRKTWLGRLLDGKRWKRRVARWSGKRA